MRGVCRVCRLPADSSSATYCAEHRPLGPDKQPRARTTSGPTDPVVEQLQANLETQLGLVAMMWGMRDEVCAEALGKSAPAIAEYWAGRARESPAIARALDSAVGAGGVLAGIAVHAPLMLAVMAHHVAPAIERRRQALTADVPEVELPIYPASGGIHDGAAAPSGTMVDPHAEAAAAAATAAPEGVWIQPGPGMTPPGAVFDPIHPDDRLGWEAAEAAAVAAATEGIPFGAATYDGHPVWETEPGANGTA